MGHKTHSVCWLGQSPISKFLVQGGGEVKYIYVVVLQCDGFFKYFCPVAQAPLSLIRGGCWAWGVLPRGCSRVKPVNTVKFDFVDFKVL